MTLDFTEMGSIQLQLSASAFFQIAFSLSNPGCANIVCIYPKAAGRMESHRVQPPTWVAALPADVILHLPLAIKTRVPNTAAWKEVSYLQFVEGHVAKVAIHLGVVQGLSRALQQGGTQGKRLQVAIFCHLIHMQKVVDCSQAVECNQLLQLVSWKRVANTVSLQHARNTSPAQPC